VNFSFNSNKIGYWNLEFPFEVKAGEVNDLVLTATFNPSLSDTWTLLSKYQQKQLVIDVTTNLQASLYLLGYYSPPISVTK
jgi:hypothetical protein